MSGIHGLLDGQDLDERLTLERLINQEREEVLGAPPQSKPYPTHKELVAHWPDGKTRLVAEHQVFSDRSMKPLEAWRKPSDSEDRSLYDATVLQGGVEDVAAGKPAGGLPWGKIIAGVAGLGAVVAGGAWYLTRDSDAPDEEPEPELEEDEEEDEEEED